MDIAMTNDSLYNLSHRWWTSFTQILYQILRDQQLMQWFITLHSCLRPGLLATTIFKLVSAIFTKFLFLHQIIAFKNNEKCFLFHLKSSFYSQIFVFLSFPLFLPVSHCFRGWSKINLKVHDIINCVNKNSITHFVWYLENKKGMTLKPCP